MNKPEVIYLFGPTASGKTEMAIRLMERLPVSLISVDSALVYRGMDIGTAKPDRNTLQRYPHALIDICEPTESYSAAKFIEDCNREIDLAHRAGRIPVCVGGTMMYFQALTFGLSELPQASPELRTQLLKEADAEGWEAMHARLQAVDPVAAARIHPNDPQRIQRALEIYLLTSKPMTWHLENQQQTGLSARAEIKAFAMNPPERGALHQRIEQRFDAMIEAGFVEEVAKLMQVSGLEAASPSMRSVGYRQIWAHLAGETAFPEMRQQALAATRQLAKRQLTWLRNHRLPITWLDVRDEGAISTLLEHIVV